MGSVSHDIFAWLPLGLSALLCLVHLVLHFPIASKKRKPLVEHGFAYAALLFGLLASVVYFLAYTDDDLRSQNWIRYVGHGTSLALYVSAFALLAGGGALYALAAPITATIAGACLVFVSLLPEKHLDNVGFYVIGGFIYVVLCVFMTVLDNAQEQIAPLYKMAMRALILAYVALAGVDELDPKLLGRTLEYILFGGLNLATAAFVLTLYFLEVPTALLRKLLRPATSAE